MNRKLAAAILVLALTVMACGQVNEVMSNIAGTLEATMETPAVEEPPAEPTTPSRPAPGGTIRQWATSAVASSEYGDPDWAAMQATGAPDTPECGDNSTAWASVEGDTVEWIELTYKKAVKPTEVNIVQTYNPNQVVKVELIDQVAGYHTIYTGAPAAVRQCPYVLSIPVNADYTVAGIRITIDQSVLQDWNEIDAVELVGVPE